MKAAALRWVSELARQNPEAFGDASNGSNGMEEPSASSHESCVFGVDGTRVHVKFFRRTLGRTGVTYDPCGEMKAEYAMLKEYEKNGFSSGPYRIVRALGVNEALDCALATVYVGGATLLSLIQDTLKGSGEEDRLMVALDLTAGLLRKIHTVMPQDSRVDASEMFYSYLKPMLYLEEQGALDGFHRRIAKGLTRWHSFKPLFEQRGVTVHGDANPSNFKIQGGVVYGFDVERSRPGRSPLLDLGTVVAELSHQCAYLAKDEDRARPYIARFLTAYAPDAGEREKLLRMLPFYVSRGFLKIAMLGYWKPDYRRYLVERGTRCIEVVP
ncbi:phosphotransferase [Methanocella conradii]|uniref:phosphotransferase n=1 Tax=Methanocella conradii TaxID=1175444 RepID=UPI00157C769E|nr:phosphotransferase [Methanocella conradii]